MFKKLLRILLILVVVGILVWLFAPRIFGSAANSFISSPNSQAQGMAQFMPAQAISSTNNKGDLQVNLTGLEPDTAYDLSLDQNQCGENTVSLGSAKSDANGNFYVELPLNSLNTQQTWYIDVSQQGQSVACGLLQTNQAVSSQVIHAGPNVFGPQTPDAQAASTPDTAASEPQQNNSSSSSSTVPNLPETGADPGNSQQYDNNRYPRKY